MTTFHIITAGCSHNFADSEQMAGLLQEAQFTLANNLEDADIVVFNTCTVKGPTENTFFKRLGEIKKEYPYKVIVIAGCIPQTDPQKLKSYCLLGTKQIHKIVEIVEEALNDNTVKMLKMGEMPPLNLPKIRKNPVVEIIPISRGCLSACTFCKTKAARGNLQSYPIKDILALALRGINERVKEIWLTSQDTMCYGFDIGTNLPQLLGELIKIPGKFKIRIGMGSPVHLKKIKKELFPLLNHQKIFQFLHLPAQTGSNKVLQEMCRKNTTEEYLKIIQELRIIVPKVTLATDIIVGYPTEEDDDFWQTLELVKKTTPEVINLSKFWPRPKTKAAELKPLLSEVVKHRLKVLTDISQNIALIKNEKWIDWQGEIIIDERGKLPQQWIGRNPSYKQVIVEGDYKLGDIIKVKINKVTNFDLRGEVI